MRDGFPEAIEELRAEFDRLAEEYSEGAARAALRELRDSEGL